MLTTLPVHPAAPPLAYVHADRNLARCLVRKAGAVITYRDDYSGTVEADFGNGHYVRVSWIMDRAKIVAAYNEGIVSPWQGKIVDKCEAAS